MAQFAVTMIDYGASNLRSAQKAFEHQGAAVTVTNDPAEVLKAGKLVLPGVGAFGAGMDALRRRGLDEAAVEAVNRGTPLLGICLGMQFLFESSDEMGDHRGLGLISGHVTRFPALTTIDPADASRVRPLKVPHMGWNEIEHDGTHPLLAGVPSGAHGYFVHSYYCHPAVESDVIARTNYGIDFCSIVGRGRVSGIQFHPEKSHQVGLRIIRNYLEMG